jgi:hypothetical protein
MRRLLLSLIVLFFAASANAQWRRFGDNDDYNRGPDWRSGPYRGGADVISRALRDIESARSYRYSGNHQRRHFEDARKDLLRFQDRWYRGDFDRGRLDNAIGHIDHIVRSREIEPYERRILERDLWDLRSFRERRGDGRYSRGYRPGW